MRALVQRVSSGRVEVADREIGRIDNGLLVYVGVGVNDSASHAAKLAEKIAGLRVFEDDQDKLNLCVRDVWGGVLVIPNFTLRADARKGRRPCFAGAAGVEAARPIFEAFVSALEQNGCRVARGAFGEHMTINAVADGPVNLIVDFPPPQTNENMETTSDDTN